jgi:hypothetical protein
MKQYRNVIAFVAASFGLTLSTVTILQWRPILIGGSILLILYIVENREVKI